MQIVDKSQPCLSAIYRGSLPVLICLLACSAQPDRAPQTDSALVAASLGSSPQRVDDNSPPPRPKTPPTAHQPPKGLAPLEVPGFNAATHVAPDNWRKGPKPAVVVLHGNYDRPEWECELWKAVAGFYGWILCPRGIPSPGTTRAEDRWTYRGSGAADREIRAGLDALKQRYPGRVDEDGTALVGFSLGAILSPAIVRANPGKYRYVFVIEGGLDKLNRPGLRSLARAGVRGVGFAMSAPSRIRRAKKALAIANKLKLNTVFVDMRGSGHGYSGDFATTGRAAFAKLIAQRRE